jgi:hypothetical protein
MTFFKRCRIEILKQAFISAFVKVGHVMFTVLLALCLVTVLPLPAQGGDVFLHDDFNDLENWKPLYFPKIRKHSTYSIVKNGTESYLKCESHASASAMVLNKEFNVFEYPKVRWRWKVDNIYKKGNSLEKSGDDYPIRVYIFFKYEPEKASFGERIQYGLAKAFYGKYPPYSSLNYIWESRRQENNMVISPYAQESMMIILEAGEENVGKWKEEDINIIDDYHKAFGKDPPSIASIAVMNDSDDTGESSVSYFDYIEIYR